MRTLPARRRPPTPNPLELLSATELAQRLGVSVEMVHRKEQAGELFSTRRKSVIPQYFAFQAWPEVKGAPLTQVLCAFGPNDRFDRENFFTTRSDLLGYLTPLETLVGRVLWVGAKLDPGAARLLELEFPVRLDGVCKLARTLMDERAAW